MVMAIANATRRKLNILSSRRTLSEFGAFRSGEPWRRTRVESAGGVGLRTVANSAATIAASVSWINSESAAEVIFFWVSRDIFGA